jgi:amino acid permease
MLGIILIYWVGKAFYDLAGKHGRHQWGYGILGVASYYGGLYGGIFVIGLVLAVVSPESIDGISDIQATIMGIPFGVLICWLTYTLLKKSWSKPKEISRNTLDSDLIPSDINRYDKTER